MRHKNLNYWFLIILAVLLNLPSFSQITAQKEKKPEKVFRASVVKVDITPCDPQYLLGYQERKSTGVHDHIFHRIAVLDDGTTQFLPVSTEVGIFSPLEYDKIASLLNRQLGIKPVNFWWAVTHTHSAPELGFITEAVVAHLQGELKNHAGAPLK